MMIDKQENCRGERVYAIAEKLYRGFGRNIVYGENMYFSGSKFIWS